MSQINLNKDILTNIRQDLIAFREEICDQIETLKRQTLSNESSITVLQAETSDIHNQCSIQGRNYLMLCPNFNAVLCDVLEVP